jgi:hypothetical protein
MQLTIDKVDQLFCNKDIIKMPTVLNAKTPDELKTALETCWNESQEIIENTKRQMKAIENMQYYRLFEAHTELLVNRGRIIRDCHLLLKNYRNDNKACAAIQRLFYDSIVPVEEAVDQSITRLMQSKDEIYKQQKPIKRKDVVGANYDEDDDGTVESYSEDYQSTGDLEDLESDFYEAGDHDPEYS